MNSFKSFACPLCSSSRTEIVLEKEGREYIECKHCLLVFVPETYHLSFEEEKKRYDTHQNSSTDLRYRAFLNRLAEPLQELIEPPAQGLDYGCGPGPTLSQMLSEQGFKMDVYDPFYFSDKSIFAESYDFITCTEVAEHFRNPAKEFRKLNTLLKDSGILAIMTSFRPLTETLAKWWYLKDPTHISFYERRTFEWIAQKYSAEVDFPTENVAILSIR